MSTVSSNLLPSVLMMTASSAIRSGATGRLESIASRRRSSARISAAAVPSGAMAPLRRAPAGPLLHRRVEVELQVGVGQHDRADVAAGHDDPAGRCDPPLPLEEGRPHLGQSGDLGDALVDGRRVHLRRDVDAVDEDAVQPALRVGRELDAGPRPPRGVAPSSSGKPRWSASQVSARYSRPVSQKP